MLKAVCIGMLIALLLGLGASRLEVATGESAQPRLSSQTQMCVGCHRSATPGIVSDWTTSRHAQTTPAEAWTKPQLERRISTPLELISPELRTVAVGCFECHSRNIDKHADAFEHFGFRIATVVSPADCQTCHGVEATQYAASKKAHAHDNLLKNPVFTLLMETITQRQRLDEHGQLLAEGSSPSTQHETCLGCHGTRVQAKGLKAVKTAMGTISVPDLEGWPNEGVGRINPDGSLGSCSACHPRHSFSIAVARKPYTCGQCHLDPDVPAWNVFKESKHGNIVFSREREYNWEAVPWAVGRDFQAPSCATCHNSLLVDAEGRPIIERTHDFGSRLWVRLFGVIYAHPQPRDGRTYLIKNRDGLPLPTTFTGEPATEFLLSPQEQQSRQEQFQMVCNACHSRSWIAGHFAKLDQTIAETNQMTLTATLLAARAWEGGLAKGLPGNPFDEEIEQLWIKQWLFYSNSIRYASAMSGAPDYATFKHGWWNLNETLQQMREWLKLRRD